MVNLKKIFKDFNKVKAREDKTGDFSIHACRKEKPNPKLCLYLGLLSSEDIIGDHFGKDISKISEKDWDNFYGKYTEIEREKTAKKSYKEYSSYTNGIKRDIESDVKGIIKTRGRYRDKLYGLLKKEYNLKE